MPHAENGLHSTHRHQRSDSSRDDRAHALPVRARRLLEWLWGDAANFDPCRIEGHEVWRVRQDETGKTAIVKCGANVAIAHTMADSGVAPQVLAVDDAAGICVMKDVGPTTLLDILATGDSEAASEGLFSLARTAGALRGWSSTPESPKFRPPPVARLPLSAFMDICGALGVNASRARGEFVEAERCMRKGKPQVVIHGDLCPDNFVPGPPRSSGRFVDFEAAHRGNAILEAACWHMPLPTCWKVARVPLELLPRMDARSGHLAVRQRRRMPSLQAH